MSESQVSTKILTVANLLTFLRMALIPFFAILLVYNREGWALLVFTVAGVSDGIEQPRATRDEPRPARTFLEAESEGDRV